MKKIIKVSSLFLAFAVLAVSFSACGSVKGSKYKNDANSNLFISFAKDGTFKMSAKVLDEEVETYKGTYKVKGKKITVKLESPASVTWKYTIQDKKKLKDQGGLTWTKI